MKQIQSGCEVIAIERQRQISIEGWTPEHDDQHADGELAQAAACYATAAYYCVYGWDPKRAIASTPFPWPGWWKPDADPVHNLAKAGALIAAEIDRLQRESHTD